jgi:hypothetical protein
MRLGRRLKRNLDKPNLQERSLNSSYNLKHKAKVSINRSSWLNKRYFFFQESRDSVEASSMSSRETATKPCLCRNNNTKFLWTLVQMRQRCTIRMRSKQSYPKIERIQCSENS